MRSDFRWQRLPRNNVSAETVWLDDLNLTSATQGWGEPHKNKSVEGHPLTIGGKEFARGFGTHAESSLQINLGGGAQKFSASVGVDDEVNKNPASSVEFIVRGDGKVLWRSGVLHAGDAAKDCAVDLTGVKSLVLEVGDAGDGIDFDHADWANAKFETAGAKLSTPPAIQSLPWSRLTFSRRPRRPRRASTARTSWACGPARRCSIHDSGDGRPADEIFRTKSAVGIEGGCQDRSPHRQVEEKGRSRYHTGRAKFARHGGEKISHRRSATRLRSRRRWAGTVGIVLPARFRRRKSSARRMRW